MDPNLFHLDWERTFEGLTLVIILAFLLERALSVLFEHRMFIKRFDGSGVKEVIALAAAIAVCVVWQFDVVSMIVLTEANTVPGYIITGAVVAGGSKASIKLFHDLLNVKSTAYEQRHEIVADYAARGAEESAAKAGPEMGVRPLSTIAAKTKKQAETARQASMASGSVAAAASADKAEAAAKSVERKAVAAQNREQPRGGAPS